MHALWSDWRLAARSLRRAPGFTAVVVLTLALGIGPTTAIFSVVYGVLLRPFPYRAPESLVVISAERTFAGQVRGANYSARELDGWLARARAFSSLGMWGGTGYSLRTDAGTQTVGAAYVSDGFFATLGVPMALGRAIGPADAGSPVAVVSHRLWRRELGSSPQAVGRSIRLNGQPYTVIGVAPPDFRFPSERDDVWTPLAYAQRLGREPWVNNPAGGGFHLVGRLRPGVTLAAARDDAARVARAMAPEFARISGGRRPLLFTLVGWFTDTTRPALLMLAAAVGLVLVVACANTVNLLFARQTSRSQEIAVRRALGAPPSRLLSSALAEASLVALAGGGAGVLLAVGGVRALLSLWPAGLPRVDAIRVDGPVLAFALALSMGLALACAIGPGVRALGYRLAAGLRPAGAASTRRGRRLRSALVVVQIAASVILLVGAGLLGRSFVRLLRSDVGVGTNRVALADLALSVDRQVSPAIQVETVDRVLDGVRRIPGVVRAGVGTSLPLYGARFRYTLKGVQTGDGPPRDYDVDAIAVTPGFFAALELPLLRGRLFTDGDTAASPPVMIMSARTARRFFGDRDAIGRTLSLPTAGGPGRAAATLVGVVGDVKYNALDAAADGGIYRPYTQQAYQYVYLAARTAGDPRAVGGALRRAVAAVDPSIAVDHVRTFDDEVASASAEPRFRTLLLVALAALALAVASVGLYGAVAYSVSLRRTELGIRVALGATPANLVRLVVREGMALACVGAGIGVAGAAVLSRVLQRFLYGVTPHDAVSLLAAPTGLLLLAALASYVPARRAAAADPIAALRRE